MSTTKTQRAAFSDLIGKRLVRVERSVNKWDGGDEIQFACESGELYSMHHVRDCCEHVSIEDVCGELADLVGQVVVDAFEKQQLGDCWSSTWTFYTIRTQRTTVTIRWFGESNGNYSETADFMRLVPV